jgi:8-oxo-dGTP diphosphatase
MVIYSSVRENRESGILETGSSGGTLEERETYEQCLKREFQEEFTITTEVGDFLCSSEHSYTTGWTIKLLAYRTKMISGIFNLNDHDEIRWVKPTDLYNYLYEQVSRPILEKLARTPLFQQ